MGDLVKVLVLGQQKETHEYAQNAYPEAEMVFDSGHFGDFCLERIPQFLDFADSLTANNMDNLSWCASSVASKSIFQSPFFMEWCYFRYTEEIASKVNVDLVICENSRVGAYIEEKIGFFGFGEAGGSGFYKKTCTKNLSSLLFCQDNLVIDYPWPLYRGKKETA